MVLPPQNMHVGSRLLSTYHTSHLVPQYYYVVITIATDRCVWFEGYFAK